MNGKTLKQKFGRRVRSLRHTRDLTQEQLAEKAGMSPEYVSKIERGEASVSFKFMARLSTALKVDPVELFDFSQLSSR